ncbi:MAG: hypothetical protein A2589_01345 [Candidatus Vogelbacteria bacterium RIFOXYD1_FULL_46_19]|uniref:Uncharacterized protein n=1 Tax=Candidatus Vogelbacteria bacterium RIFOXYD1_FULL_46_19 TaxID=1802439 RepID=A0A1G2QHC7_9BACT|nr:MAG: hypothetical protein A2589_01345 [Candidatus Vogelbacteria bacterium RIFOXYD1_FULL_46_19]
MSQEPTIETMFFVFVCAALGLLLVTILTVRILYSIKRFRQQRKNGKWLMILYNHNQESFLAALESREIAVYSQFNLPLCLDEFGLEPSAKAYGSWLRCQANDQEKYHLEYGPENEFGSKDWDLDKRWEWLLNHLRRVVYAFNGNQGKVINFCNQTFKRHEKYWNKLFDLTPWHNENWLDKALDLVMSKYREEEEKRRVARLVNRANQALK